MLIFSQPEKWIFPHCFFSILHFQAPYNKKKNDDLTAALEKSQQQSTLKKLQEAKLQQDYADACAILDRIPPEIIREYTHRSTQKHDIHR